MNQTNSANHTVVLTVIEAAINQTLKLDPTAHKRLSKLSGHIFQVDCSQPKFNIYLCPEAGTLRFLSYFEGKVTTAIRGSALEFITLATATDPGGVLINSQICLEGDSAPLIELQRIVSQLDLDWEAPIVEILGDVLGHQLANIFRSMGKSGSNAKINLTRQWKDFILEEARLAPPTKEVEKFFQDNSQLTQKVDRIETSLRKIQHRFNGSDINITDNC